MDVSSGYQDGAEIRRLRRDRDLKPDEFAARVGIASSSLKNIENGNRGAGLETLTAIARELDVPLVAIVKPGTSLHGALTGTSRDGSAARRPLSVPSQS